VLVPRIILAAIGLVLAGVGALLEIAISGHEVQTGDRPGRWASVFPVAVGFLGVTMVLVGAFGSAHRVKSWWANILWFLFGSDYG
jgi:hypothetical protein